MGRMLPVVIRLFRLFATLSTLTQLAIEVWLEHLCMLSLKPLDVLGSHLIHIVVHVTDALDQCLPLGQGQSRAFGVVTVGRGLAPSIVPVEVQEIDQQNFIALPNPYFDCLIAAQIIEYVIFLAMAGFNCSSLVFFFARNIYMYEIMLDVWLG